jgi:hypothetical protein
MEIIQNILKVVVLTVSGLGTAVVDWTNHKTTYKKDVEMSDKRIKAFLVIMIGFLFLIYCSDAFALPSSARQKGLQCISCHASDNNNTLYALIWLMF